MKAVRVHSPGGPEALRHEDLPDPQPKSGQAVVMVEAAGVNFIDVYHREGLYKADMPLTLGQEGAGTVLEVAPMSRPRPGDRVAGPDSADTPRRLVRGSAREDPDGVTVRQAAAAISRNDGALSRARHTRSRPATPA
jgi:NADPH2:quinone reductase